ncbi:MAG TPA: FAD-binding oxidoreductase, partial [Planctomycetota bacterium]
MTVAPVITPADAEAAADLLATARAEGRCVLPRGRGTRVARHSPESAPDLWLSSSQWRTIHALSPDDQTCEVDAGLAPSVLEAALAPHGLELAVNAPGPAAGTLGGLFLAPDLSLLQAAWGPPRDQVLGARWLLADGSVVNTGARVVKSVAGYDVTRLFLGSRGRLACCLRLILRLRPRPRAARWFRIDPAQLCRWLAADPPARIPARRLFSTRHADGLRVCAELD